MHSQVEARLRELVRTGRLAPGAALPSSRSLAGSLGVSRGVIVEAYAQLVAEGYLSASQGAATRVALSSGAERPPLPAGSLSVRQRGIRSQRRLLVLLEEGVAAAAEEHWRAHMAVVAKVMLGQEASTVVDLLHHYG